MKATTPAGGLASQLRKKTSGHTEPIVEVGDRPTRAQADVDKDGAFRFTNANRLADLLERRSAVFLPVLLVLYVWILKSSRIKRLWHDELYTFYIAQAPSFAEDDGVDPHHRSESAALLHCGSPYVSRSSTICPFRSSAIDGRVLCRDFVCVSICSSQAHSALWPARRHGDVGQLLQSVFL